MILADKILVSIYNSNMYASTLVNEIIDYASIGEDVCELEWKFILLGEWIRILQDFYDNNFTTEGEIVEPPYQTITLAQAEELMAKLKLAIGTNKYPINMFSLGIWSDDLIFAWNDLDTWYDTPPLI
jgi:hypothetical protein